MKMLFDVFKLCLFFGIFKGGCMLVMRENFGRGKFKLWYTFKYVFILIFYRL